MSRSTENPEQGRFDQWLMSVSPQASHQVKGTAMLVAESEDHSAFHQFKDTLDPTSQQATKEEADKRTDWPQGRKPRHCLIVQKEGEWPALKIFPDLATMLLRLKEMEGKDIVAISILGIPLPFTKAPDRLVMLPDNSAAQIRNGHIIDEIHDEVTLQDDWFLGPVELSIATSRPDDEEDVEAVSKKKGKIPKPPGGDEDEDEEEEEGGG